MSQFYPHQFIVQTNTAKERAELQLIHRWCFGNKVRLAQMSNIQTIVHHETRFNVSLQDVFGNMSLGEFKEYLRENRIEITTDLFHDPNAFQKTLEHIKVHDPILYCKFSK